MLIPLSHWAHGRGAAHKLHIAALCGGLSRLILSLSVAGPNWGCLCFDKLSIPIVTQSPQLVEFPADGVAGLGGLAIQAHCLSGHSHYPPPQPPAQLLELISICGNLLILGCTLIIVRNWGGGQRLCAHGIM